MRESSRSSARRPTQSIESPPTHCRPRMVHQRRRGGSGHQQRLLRQRGWPTLSLEPGQQLAFANRRAYAGHRRAVCADDHWAGWDGLHPEWGHAFAVGPKGGVVLTLTSSKPTCRAVLAGESLTFTANAVGRGLVWGPLSGGTMVFTDAGPPGRSRRAHHIGGSRVRRLWTARDRSPRRTCLPGLTLLHYRNTRTVGRISHAGADRPLVA